MHKANSLSFSLPAHFFRFLSVCPVSSMCQSCWRLYGFRSFIPATCWTWWTTRSWSNLPRPAGTWWTKPSATTCCQTPAKRCRRPELARDCLPVHCSAWLIVSSRLAWSLWWTSDTLVLLWAACMWVCFFMRFGEIQHYITCSAMDALQWMGAVRMRVQTADKNITVIHTTPVHRSMHCKPKAACSWETNPSLRCF